MFLLIFVHFWPFSNFWWTLKYNSSNIWVLHKQLSKRFCSQYYQFPSFFFSNIASQCVISGFLFYSFNIFLMFLYLITCYLCRVICFRIHCFYFVVLFIYNLCDIVFFIIVKVLSDWLCFVLGWLLICNLTWYIIRS